MADCLVEEVLANITSGRINASPGWWILQLEKLRQVKAWYTIILLAENFNLELGADHLTKKNWRIIDELAIARYWVKDYTNAKALTQCILADAEKLELTEQEVARLLQNEDFARVGLGKKTTYDSDVEKAQKQHKKLVGYLKGKRVALVGPAPYLEGQGKGKEIDGYDVVIRVNKGWQLAEKRPEDFGSRTDILYHCVEQHAENGGPLPNDKLQSTRFICGAIPPLGKQEKSTLKGWGSDHLYRLLFAQQRLNRMDAKLACTKKEWYLKLEERCSNTRPNTGLITMIDLLENAHLKELWVSGFTFFKGGYCKDYREYTEEQVLDRMKRAGNHFQDKQLSVVAPLLLENDCVRLDQEVKEVLDAI